MKNKFFKMFGYLRQLFTNENPDNKSDVKKEKFQRKTTCVGRMMADPWLITPRQSRQWLWKMLPNRPICLEKSRLRACDSR